MSKNKVKEHEKEDDVKLHLEAYKVLVDMLKKDDILSWQQNGILIAINGGLLTALGSIQPKDPAVIILSINVISSVICILGVVICCFWCLIANRMESFYNHWYEQLKHLEQNYLKNIQVFTIADNFFEKKQITLGGQIFKLRFLSGLVKMFTVIQFLTIVFIIVWIFLLVYFSQKL